MSDIDWWKVIRKMDEKVGEHMEKATMASNAGEDQKAFMQIGIAEALLSISWALQAGMKS